MDLTSTPLIDLDGELIETVDGFAHKWHLPTTWLIAQIHHESGFNQYAKRVEPGFMKRYGAQVGVLADQLGCSDLWVRNPLDFNASYGLMQIMWSTAVERGFKCRYPSELFDVEDNLDYGCAELVRQLNKANGDLGMALDAYNDGRLNQRTADGKLSDHDYTDRVRRSYSYVWGAPVPDFPMLG